MERRRAFLLGIDGLPPRELWRFLGEGVAPRLSAWLERACLFDMQPTLPALTAPGWLTIASGALPSTLGVESILVPVPGGVPSEIQNGFDASLISPDAEMMWQSLDRQGHPAIVFKYPGSWPPRSGGFVQVDGAGGYADITCLFEAITSRAYVSRPVRADGATDGGAIFPSGYGDSWRIDTGADHSLAQVVARRPAGWTGLPSGAAPVFEFVVHRQHTRVPLMGLACEVDGAPRLFLVEGKDARKKKVDLGVGDWSPFQQAGERGAEFAYRYKLVSLDLAEQVVHLYQSDGHRLRGHTRPEALADELLERLGPPVEWTGTYDVMNGLIDLETQLEIYRAHTRWMADTIRHLGKTRRWRGFFTHYHVVEYAHHMTGASLYPEHPRHDPSTVERDLDFLRRTYALLDELVAAVEDISDPDTLVVLASDHGHDLVHSVFHVNQFLLRGGWLALREGGGRPEIDWSRSAAYGLFPGLIYLNERGRWAQGSLAPSDLPRVAAEIGDALRQVIDPTTGRRAVTHVLGRDELAVYGQTGPRAPDLFFAMDRGYEVASRFSAGDAPLFEVTEPFAEVTSGHGSFHPHSASARTLAAFAGPGIPTGARGRYPGHVMDIAPTISAWLGVEPPRGCDGRPISFDRVVRR